MKSRLLNRLSGYDYNRDARYFFTSCVKGRVCCFGDVSNGRMHLNAYGQIARDQWHWLGQQYPYVRLHAFVVMPNHVHGILEIDRSAIPFPVGTGRDLSLHSYRDLSLLGMDETRDLSLHMDTDADTPMKIKSLSELKGAYKTTVSKHIHLAGYTDFAWQRSFHDHIIRDDKAYEAISQYIHNNPANWRGDDFYSTT